MTDKGRQEDIALQFNQYINHRDLEGLSSLMTDDHALIIGNNPASSTESKDKSLQAWREFFDLFPDYQNTFEKVEIKDDSVKITGYSTCSDKRLEGPALWLARIRDYKVSEWHVYDDKPENRKLLDIG